MHTRQQPASRSRTPIRVVVQQPALPRYRVPVFAELARRPGIRLKVVHGDSGGPPNVPGKGFDAEYVPLHRGGLFGRPVYWHGPQWAYATRANTDVLILTWDLHFASLVPALVRARLNGVPTILWGHGYSKNESGWRSWARRNVTRLASALLLYNHATAQRYRELDRNPNRIFVALNSLDQTPIREAKEAWSHRHDDLSRFRKQNDLCSGPVVLFVSRLDPANRLDLLLQSVAMLRQDFPTLKVVIIGNGQAEKSRLRVLAESLDVTSHIRFVDSTYDESRLAPWFLIADVFCYPANIGLSILHAFGYGLPVITSDRIAAQNPEIEALQNGRNGILYRDDNAPALADTLRRVVEDRSLARTLSENALRTVTQWFNLKNMVDGMDAAIRYSTLQG